MKLTFLRVVLLDLLYVVPAGGGLVLPVRQNPKLPAETRLQDGISGNMPPLTYICVNWKLFPTPKLNIIHFTLPL